ncbi:MAG: AMP-binding protein, partial [Deltaproteobacteria bacterium]|nr:AMP-binding protein [Deltaproteobacteria bacterium]
LFQVFFVFQGPSPPPLELAPELRVEIAPVDVAEAKFDLFLGLGEDGDELVGGLEYNADLFDATTIRRLAGQLRNLLAALVTAPERRLPQLALLSDAEAHQLLREWNDSPPLAADDGATLHALIEAQAARTPEAVALVGGREQLSYRELNARANRLAHHLRALGVGPEARVGVCMTRTPAMVVAVVGTLKAGGGYVPLDPDYPAERIAFMLEDARARALLTEEPLTAALPEHRAALVRLDADASTIAARPAGNPPAASTPANLG